LVRTHNPQAGLDPVETGLLYDPTRITALLANRLRVETLGAALPGGRVVDNLGA